MKYVWPAVVLFVALHLTGCDRSGPGAGSLSTPQGAVQRFSAAIDRGDLAAARDATTGGPARLVDVLLESLITSKRLERAAVARFGEQGKMLVGPNGAAGADYSGWAHDAEVKVAGDVATVGPRDHSQKPVALRRVNGQWKLDMSGFPEADKFASMVPLAERFSRVQDEMASEIAAGQYQSLSEARTAEGRKLMTAVGQMNASASRAATPPPLSPGTHPAR